MPLPLHTHRPHYVKAEDIAKVKDKVAVNANGNAFCFSFILAAIDASLCSGWRVSEFLRLIAVRERQRREYFTNTRSDVN